MKKPLYQDAIIGNLIDQWDRMPNDVKADIEDFASPFYLAMDRLVDYVLRQPSEAATGPMSGLPCDFDINNPDKVIPV